MKVFRITEIIEGATFKSIYKDPVEVLTFITHYLSTEETLINIKIEQTEMSEIDFNKLKEFEGY